MNLILTLIRLCYLYNNNAFIYVITSYYCTRTNLRGTYISRMLQIQHFHDFIFEDHCPDFVNDYASRNEFQGLNFCGIHVIRKNSKI